MKPPAAQDVWHSLAAPAGADRRFDAAELEGLPEAAVRYFRHTIEEGAPLARRVELAMRGTIRLGKWRPFAARQILAPPEGFVWRAAVGRGLFAIRGADLYWRGAGRLDWRVMGLVPVMRRGGTDVSMSAYERMAAETLLAPASLLPRSGASWRADGRDRLTVTLRPPAWPSEVEFRLRVEASGRPAEVAIERWGDPDGEWRRQTFGVGFEQEGRFGGYRVPVRLRAGWWYGTDRFAEGEFFRAAIGEWMAV